MSKEFKTFNSILYGNLNPDKIYAIPDDKLRSKINHIEIVKPKYEFIIYLKLSKPINHKLRYYVLLIDNTKIKYLNNAINTIKNSINKNTRYYNLCNYLENEIESLIQDCFNELNSVEKCFDDGLVLSMAQNLSSQFSTEDSPNLKDKHFIYEYLFYSLIHIHLEIQGHFYNDLNDHKTLDDFKFNYIFEHNKVLEPIFSVNRKEELNCNKNRKNTTEENKANCLKEEVSQTSEVFTPMKGDIKPPPKKIHSYDKIVKKPEWFSRFEQELYNNDFIKVDYQFKDNHGQKQELAAIYHNLISKNYFNKRTFNPIKEIKELHIRKFLDNRYGVNLDKQFRQLDNNKGKLNQILDKLPPSLKDITSC